MNKPNLKIYFKWICMISVLMFVISGCSLSKLTSVVNIDTDDTDYEAVDPGFDNAVKNTDGFYIAAENDKSQLLVSGLTTEIAVKEKATGFIWYSNPADRLNDKLSTGVNDKINATMTFNCDQDTQSMGYGMGKSTNQNAFSTTNFNSYKDSVSKRQYSFYSINNGIRINYAVGKKDYTFLCPQILTIERYNELIKKMTPEDLEIFTFYFKLFSLKDYIDDPTAYSYLKDKIEISKQRDVYVVSFLSNADFGRTANSDYVKKQIDAIMKRINYTPEELTRDNEENLVPPPAYANIYFTLSVEYTLDGSDLIVKIPRESIKYKKEDFKLVNLSLLPFFGAAGTDKAGYMFIPDGAGALINFNNGKLNIPSYSKDIYGKDVNLFFKNLDETQIYLPVFGIKQDENAFLAVIEKGDSSCTIFADISGRANSYNHVEANFTLVNKAVNQTALMAEKGLIYYQEESLQSDIQIRYMFLENTKADYTGMALRYQKYLLDNKLITKRSFTEKIPLYIDAIGAISYKDTFLGVPYNSQLSLTSYKQAKVILEELKEKGVENIDFQYTAWCNNGINNTVSDKTSLIRRLGTRNDFDALVDYTKENLFGFYPSMNFAYTTENTFYRLLIEKTQSARYLDNTITYARIESKSFPRQSAENTVILTPRFYDDMINKFIRSYKKFDNDGIGISSFGTDLNADYKRNKYSDRETAKNIIIQQLDKLQKNDYNLSITGANAYTLKSANIVNNITADSSDDYLFDATIPFYQIVLHGIVPYASEPINRSNDYATAELRIFESGSIPSFEWIYEDNTILKTTTANFYGISYKPWLNKAIDLYNHINTALADCQTSTIADHKIVSPGLNRTTYSNGIVVYVNYNDVDVMDGEITVEAKNYKVIKG
ncbi:MAG: DUF5696 domain-containing protein [Saccharofermentanales bacterium]